MELLDAINTNGACRYYKSDPVPAELIVKLLRAAQKGPTGSNRQPVQFVVVRDPDKRRAMQDLYLPIWDGYLKKAQNGERTVGGGSGFLANADHFARHFADIPVHIVVCFNIEDINPVDRDLNRISVVGGSSIYPVVQNLLLAARNEGLGSTLTTLHCIVEDDVRGLLNMPHDIAVAAVVTIGWPAKPFPKQLKRRPLAEIAFADNYGNVMPELD